MCTASNTSSVKRKYCANVQALVQYAENNSNEGPYSKV